MQLGEMVGMCQVNIGKLPFQTTKQKIQPQR